MADPALSRAQAVVDMEAHLYERCPHGGELCTKWQCVNCRRLIFAAYAEAVRREERERTWKDAALLSEATTAVYDYKNTPLMKALVRLGYGIRDECNRRATTLRTPAGETG